MLHTPLPLPSLFFALIFSALFGPPQGSFARMDLVSVECQKVNGSTLDLQSTFQVSVLFSF